MANVATTYLLVLSVAEPDGQHAQVGVSGGEVANAARGRDEELAAADEKQDGVGHSGEGVGRGGEGRGGGGDGGGGGGAHEAVADNGGVEREVVLY